MSGLSFKKPSREKTQSDVEKAAARLREGDKRIVADVPEHIHRQVRLRCMERGVLVKDYVLELLAKDGIS